MKKLLFIAAAGLLTVGVTSCMGNPNTPEGIATTAMEKMAKKDYAGYVDLMYFKGKSELSKEEKAQFVSILEEKAGKDIEKKGGIKEFKVGVPKLDGDKARVPVDITYGDGSTKKDDIAVIKTPDGDWKLDSGK